MMNRRAARANVNRSPPQPMELSDPLTSPKRSKSSSKVRTHWWRERKADVSEGHFILALHRSAGVFRHLNGVGKRQCSHVQPRLTPKRLTWLCPNISDDLIGLETFCKPLITMRPRPTAAMQRVTVSTSFAPSCDFAGEASKTIIFASRSGREGCMSHESHNFQP